MKTKRDFVKRRLGAAGSEPTFKAVRQSYFMGMDGVARPIKARGQSPLFLTFHGINTGRELNDTPYGLAQVYAASVLAWRCINVIADTFASLALRVTDGNDSDLSPDHPLCKALGKGGARLKRATAKDMQIWGVAYWEMTPHRRPMRLNPLTMEKEADKNGIRYFRQNVEGRQVTFPPERLLYFYDYDPMDDFGSVSPTQLALRSIGIETSLEEFVKTFLENYAIPAGLLTTDNHLQPSDAQRYKEDWKRRYGTDNIGDVAVLGHGLSFQTITPPLKDLVLDTLGESAARAVCQAYGVPLTMALATEAANYATLKESHQILYTETILPFADKVFGTINERPELWGNSIEVAVNEEEIAVLQEDRTEITTRAQMGFQAGYITLNEAR
ncbi:MAG: phage portal protein, partial [Anaerolineae bacterium]|nr:phage portal protein [Anaerolineae bacterium]